MPSATQVGALSHVRPTRHQTGLLLVYHFFQFLLICPSLQKTDINPLSHLSRSESRDEENSGMDSFTEVDSSILSVATVTMTPEVLLRSTTTESEAVGEVVTQQPTFDYTQSPTELSLTQPPNITEVIHEVIEKVTTRTQIHIEPDKGFVMPPTGKVLKCLQPELKTTWHYQLIYVKACCFFLSRPGVPLPFRRWSLCVYICGGTAGLPEYRRLHCHCRTTSGRIQSWLSPV